MPRCVDPVEVNPSPFESNIVNLYKEVQPGRHNFVECIVRAAVYMGPLTVVPVVLLPQE